LKKLCPNCAQNLSEISKYTEEYRKENALEKQLPTGKMLYFLRFLFFPSNLHTVEVTGSNPVSPIISFKETLTL